MGQLFRIVKGHVRQFQLLRVQLLDVGEPLKLAVNLEPIPGRHLLDIFYIYLLVRIQLFYTHHFAKPATLVMLRLGVCLIFILEVLDLERIVHVDLFN